MLWEAEAGGSGVWNQPGQRGKTLSLQKYKISQAWWWAPIVPATQEAEAGQLLEPGRWRLQWAKITPLHSSLGNRERLHPPTITQKKKKKPHLHDLQVPKGLYAPFEPHSSSSSSSNLLHSLPPEWNYWHCSLCLLSSTPRSLGNQLLLKIQVLSQVSISQRGLPWPVHLTPIVLPIVSQN